MGQDEAVFHVNEGFLQRTTFYAKHGPPRRHDLERPTRPTTQDRYTETRTEDPALFFSEGRSQTIDDEENGPIDLTDTDADYELTGKFYYCRDAFAIFIRHLHNAEPETPKDQVECRALFKAYALATYYDLEDLQNDIIKTLQRYYMSHMVPITDLMYVIDHWGDNVNTNLAAYLVAQTGFEMAQDWIRYRAENDETGIFLTSKNGVVIEEVFRAAMQHAKPQSSNDPAKNKRDWRTVPL